MQHLGITETESETGKICMPTHRRADKQKDAQMDGHTGGLTA